MRILVSGFEAFGGHSLNPTEKLVREIIARPADFAPAKSTVEVRGIVLPVTFADSFARLRDEIRAFDPYVVISLGLASGRCNSIEIERVAINCLDSTSPDNAGVQPRDLLIEDGGSAALFSTLPIRAMHSALEKAAIPAQISSSAGTYVCNYLFYRLLESSARTVRRCGFVHVPFLPEQAAKEKPGTPSMAFDVLTRAMKVMIEACSAGPSRRAP